MQLVESCTDLDALGKNQQPRGGHVDSGGDEARTATADSSVQLVGNTLDAVVYERLRRDAVRLVDDDKVLILKDDALDPWYRIHARISTPTRRKRGAVSEGRCPDDTLQRVHFFGSDCRPTAAGVVGCMRRL
mmetsp:Transcript_8685/g.26097  ORF Transcript_8685/g.26097 Transcript_8685/m.26097 type:complete len:132 (-) Transcript_8685:669-1064(-)